MVILDGTKTRPDAILGAEKAETPTTTYTKAQVDKMVLDAKTSVLADAGRARKAAEDALNRLSQVEKDMAERELEAAKDDPEGLAAIRLRQEHRATKAELAKAQQELKDKNERLDAAETDKAERAKAQVVNDIATRLKVDAERLMRLAKFTDGSPEAIEDIAKDLPKVTAKSFLKPDSGKSIGGSLTFDEVRAEYIKDPQGPYRETYLEMREQRRR